MVLLNGGGLQVCLTIDMASGHRGGLKHHLLTAKRIDSTEFCSILNQVVRDDIHQELAMAVPVIKLINNRKVGISFNGIGSLYRFPSR